MWVEGANLGDASVLAATLAAAGLDAGKLTAQASTPEVKEALKTATEQAVERGVFGAPTMFVGEQMFFGQDRLDFVREALGTP
jgi:2-hydroxychromene-2-carboxylate isomerase